MLTTSGTSSGWHLSPLDQARQIAVEVFVSESDSTGPIERVAQVPAPRGPAQPRASDVGSLCSEVSVVHRDRIATSTDRHSETTSDETRN